MHKKRERVLKTMRKERVLKTMRNESLADLKRERESFEDDAE